MAREGLPYFRRTALADNPAPPMLIVRRKLPPPQMQHQAL